MEQSQHKPKAHRECKRAGGTGGTSLWAPVAFFLPEEEACHKSHHSEGRVKGGPELYTQECATRHKEESTFHTPSHQVQLLSEVALAQPALLSISQGPRFE